MDIIVIFQEFNVTNFFFEETQTNVHDGENGARK